VGGGLQRSAGGVEAVGMGTAGRVVWGDGGLEGGSGRRGFGGRE